MKRSAPLQRKTPLKRGSWKSSPVASTDWRTQLHSGGFKSRVKKLTVAEGSKYIDACRNEECYLRVPGVCCSIGWSHDSVVDCHSNQSRHGKAGARKADNIFTVPGCGPCHAFIDQNRVGTPKQEKYDIWDRAYVEWEPVRARKMGLTMPETV
ncbi:hypothetical protein [Paraburkholderia sediminicola]|uniref:hypothetical protein n=1 Tax=Paraburkholderia sediminicola TaxID=458836 RepID=UPI0038B8358F